MIRFEINKDSFEIRGNYPQGLTVEDIRDLNADRREYWPELQETFDDLETAREVFNSKYRSLASTCVSEGWVGSFVEVVFYELIESEIDEDGDPVQELGVLDFAIEPLLPENED